MALQWDNKAAAAEAQIAELTANYEAFKQRAADAEACSATIKGQNIKLQADLLSEEDELASASCSQSCFYM